METGQTEADKQCGGQRLMQGLAMGETPRTVGATRGLRSQTRMDPASAQLGVPPSPPLPLPPHQTAQTMADPTIQVA